MGKNVKGYRQGFIEKLESGERIYEEEFLNILLSNAFGGRDFSELSGALLDRFPGVRAIIEASYGEIISVEGVTENIATYFKTLELLLMAESKHAPYIKDSGAAIELVMQRFKRRDSECVEIYFLNARGLVVDIKSFTSHKADRVDVEAGNLISSITLSKAQAIYCAHNHMNYTAAPSANDDKATDKLIQACNLCGINFVDHIIVSSTGEVFSYLKSGRLAELKSRSGLK